MKQHNSVVIALVSVSAAFIFFFCWPVYHKAYTEHMQMLEDDAWLQTQCSDPQFIVRMRQHADVCDRVRATFQQPAFLIGIQAVCPRLGWEAMAAAIAMLLIAPTVLLPYYRDRMDRLDRDRMLEACSPMRNYRSASARMICSDPF
jgi:hypothetical protein